MLVDSAVTIMLGSLFHTAIIILPKNVYVNYNAYVLIAKTSLIHDCKVVSRGRPRPADARSDVSRIKK